MNVWADDLEIDDDVIVFLRNNKEVAMFRNWFWCEKIDEDFLQYFE